MLSTTDHSPKVALLDIELLDGSKLAHAVKVGYRLDEDPRAPADALARIDCNTGAMVFVLPGDLKDVPAARKVLTEELWPRSDVKTVKIRSVFRVVKAQRE